LNPRPTISEQSKTYNTNYFTSDISPEQLLESSAEINTAKAKCFGGLKRKGRILDVGCQKGEFLKFMEKAGWEANGVELDKRAPNLYGLQIFYGRLSQAGFPNDYFDVVTLWGVIEHIYELNELMEEIHRVITPGGDLIILTTNYHSLATGLLKLDDIPRHVLLFTKKTIKALLEKYGFQVKKIYCSDKIFKASTCVLLQYLFARFVTGGLDAFYRDFFRVQYQKKRDLSGRFKRILSMGPIRGLVYITDRMLGLIVDRISLFLGFYGVIIIKATKGGDSGKEKTKTNSDCLL